MKSVGQAAIQELRTIKDRCAVYAEDLRIASERIRELEAENARLRGVIQDSQRLTHLIRQADFLLTGGLHEKAASEIQRDVDWRVNDVNCDQELFRRAIDKDIQSAGYPNNDPAALTDERKVYVAYLKEHK